MALQPTIVLLMISMQQLEHHSLRGRKNDDTAILTTDNQAALLRQVDAGSEFYCVSVTAVQLINNSHRRRFHRCPSFGYAGFDCRC